MPRKALLCAMALLLSAGQAATQEAPEIRQFDVSTIQKLGRDIFEQDEAAWHATDALMARRTRQDLESERVRGWIVAATPEGPLVRYLRQGADGLEAAYDIHDPAGKPRISVPQDRILTAQEKAQFAARILALRSLPRGCSSTYNTVVLKDPEGDGWIVWAIAATTDPDIVLTGGHYRITVSADGEKVSRLDALSRSCLVLPKTQDGKKVELLFSTQLVSMIPVETFVFLSLQHRTPIYVGTPDRILWAIEGDNVRNVGPIPVPPDAK